MPLFGDTGNGATLVMSGTALTNVRIKSIQIGEITIDALDVSTLATTAFMEEIQSDLAKAPEVTVTCVHVTSATLPVIDAVPQTCTISFPLQVGNILAANFAGTGFYTSIGLPQLANGEIQELTFKFKFDGDTGPVYTAATTA